MNDRERVLFGLQILLGVIIAVLAFWLALGKQIPQAPRPPRQTRSVPTDIKPRSIRSNGSVPRCQLNLDDEKTTGTTNQVIPVFNIYDDPLKRRNAVTVPATDLMDIDLPVIPLDPEPASIHEDMRLDEVAPVTTPTHGATRPTQDR